MRWTPPNERCCCICHVQPQPFWCPAPTGTHTEEGTAGGRNRAIAKEEERCPLFPAASGVLRCLLPPVLTCPGVPVWEHTGRLDLSFANTGLLWPR